MQLMASEEWAKLYTIKRPGIDRQILFYLDKALDKDDMYDIHQIVNQNGEKIDIMLRNVPANQIEKCFGEIDEAYAATALDIIDGIVNDYDRRKDEFTLSDTAL